MQELERSTSLLKKGIEPIEIYTQTKEEKKT